MSNSQRVAIITGASQGIGESLVTAYRKLGYAVVANSRTIAESDDPMVVTVPGDIAQTGVGQRIVDAAMENFGRVDTVVNNAGIFIPKPFIDYTDEDYDAITGVNLRGFFEVSRGGRRDAVTGGGRSHREHLHQPRRPRQLCGALGVGVTDEGRAERGNQGAGGRICRPRHSL
jgi:NAD(P)-dependent dehydrogenase (short-subunit alcohol dehydrogenase family)